MNQAKRKDTQSLKSKIEKFSNSNILIVVFSVVVVLISSVLTIAQGAEWLMTLSNETVFNKSFNYKLIKKLKVNTDISNIIEILGNPIQKKKFSEFTQYVFSNKYFYTTAVVNNDGLVLSLAITSRRTDFTPSFEAPGFAINGRIKEITLNKTSFFDIQSNDEKSCFLWTGIRRFSYFEGMYLGNPSNYQTIYFGINDAGPTVNKESFFIPENDVWESHNGPECNLITDLDRKNIINTYVITSPLTFFEEEISTSSANIVFGPDLDQVRVLEED